MPFKSPADIAQASCTVGKTKSEMKWDRLLILGFLAGAYIAFGGLLAQVVGGAVPGIKADNPGLQKFIFGGVFPVGLMLVVIAGSELFTGNCLLPIISALNGKAKWGGVFKNWVFVYLGNFVGSLFVAFCLAYVTQLLAKDPWLASAKSLAEAKAALPFWVAFFRGIGCNWLVCLAVWMAISSDDIIGKVWAIWFPIMAFVAIGFEHSVANMYFIPTGMFYGANVTWGQFLIGNLLPVTLGNIVGGAGFVAVLYWYVYLREKPAPTPAPPK
jgi:formate/nitrite transporter